MFFDWDMGVLFVHNPRAAGTAVRLALCSYKGEPQAISRKGTKIKYDRFNRVSVHSFARDLRRHPKLDKFDSYWRFGVIRDPWARAVSLYQYCQEQVSPLGESYMRVGLWDMSERDKNRAIAELDGKPFSWWLTTWCDRHKWSPWQYIGDEKGVFRYDQLSWFTDKDGSDLVHEIYRCEHLSSLRRRLSKKLRTQIEIKPVNYSTADTDDYADWYDDEARAFIEERFARDIKRFNYSFGGGDAKTRAQDMDEAGRRFAFSNGRPQDLDTSEPGEEAGPVEGGSEQTDAISPFDPASRSENTLATGR